MCGIVGYIGEEQAAPILLNGLQKLEYRGYDSAGVAVYNDSGVHVVKSKGRLSVLDGILQGGKELPGTVGIGHTRWATHGAPSDVNSHPQVSDGGLFAVVHNGIIENYLYLKNHLIRRGVEFVSDTDTGSGSPDAGILLQGRRAGDYPEGHLQGGGQLRVGHHLRRLPGPHLRRAEG